MGSRAMVGMEVEAAGGKGTPGSKNSNVKIRGQDRRQRGDNAWLCQPSFGV